MVVLVNTEPMIELSSQLQPSTLPMKGVDMLILNSTHPLTEIQCAQIEALTHASIEEVRTLPVQIDQGAQLAEQITALVNTVGLASDEWQKRPLLINLPGYAPAAFVLLAEIYGRIGHFPSLIRLRPCPGPIVTYEVAEILNLQTVREAAHRRR